MTKEKGAAESVDRLRLHRIGRMARGLLGGAIAALVCAAWIGPPAARAAEYAVRDRIPGPAAVAGWDYAMVDSAAGMLFLSVYGARSGLIRLDLHSGRVTHLVADRLPHGIAIVGDGLAAVANAATNEVGLSREADLGGLRAADVAVLICPVMSSEGTVFSRGRTND